MIKVDTVIIGLIVTDLLIAITLFVVFLKTRKNETEIKNKISYDRFNAARKTLSREQTKLERKIRLIKGYFNLKFRKRPSNMVVEEKDKEDTQNN